jgi:DNA invertase Pin-like site-specific DNA recombinase
MQETPEHLIRRLELLPKQTVWGYVRVSSDSQEDNQSLGMQKQDIEKYCKDHSIDPPQFVEEVASAAKPMWVVNLPGAPAEDKALNSSPRPLLLTLITHLKKMRESLGKQVPLHLVLWKLDRLARVDYEQELFFTMFQKDAIQLHSVMPTEDHMLDGGHVRDPARAFTRTVMAAVASYERSMIELRMGSGMAYKAAQGGFTGGVQPFGYVIKNADLVIDPHEAQIVRYVYYLKHRYEMSNVSISRWMMKNKDPKDDNYYDRYKIDRIIRNKQLYLGVYKDRYGSLHPRPDLKILPDNPEALLDYVEFAATQSQRAEGQRLSDADHQATPERTGDDHRPGGSAGDERSEGAGQAGLPAHLEEHVSTAGCGEPGADRPLA